MKRRSLIAAFAARALVLAACGGDDDTADTAETDPRHRRRPRPRCPPTSHRRDDIVDDDVEMTRRPPTMILRRDVVHMTMTVRDTRAMADRRLAGQAGLHPDAVAGGRWSDRHRAAAGRHALGALGIPVEAIVPSDYAGVIVALQSGQAQVAGGLGPAQMVHAADTAGADLILQAVRFGSSQYVTQWFTNNPDEFCADTPVADEDGLLFCNGVDQAPPVADRRPDRLDEQLAEGRRQDGGVRRPGLDLGVPGPCARTARRRRRPVRRHHAAVRRRPRLGGAGGVRR